MSTITGTPGNDNLIGTSANDYIDGGLGTDTMTGGLADDVYIVDNPADLVVEKPGEGNDRINSIVSYTLPANVETLWLVGTVDSNGTGNDQGCSLWGNLGTNVLKGGAGDDYIDGGTGADTLIGGGGNDLYWVDSVSDVVTETSGEGNDTVISSLPNYSLPANVENLTLKMGSGNISGTGNDLGNYLTGNEGSNILTGGTGDDYIDGGAGADTMIGRAGNDTYYIDNSGDVVTENPGEGNDTVFTTVSYVLPANVENLVLKVGAGNINGTGNDLGNHLTGNEGNNVLIGGSGNDLIDGKGGNDILTGGGGEDVFYIATAYSGKVEITDLVAGDTIQVCGSQLFGAISAGNGSSLSPGDLQVSVSGGTTTLHVGVDPSVGHPVDITLDGAYSASNFTMSGFEIKYDTNHAPVLANQPPDQTVVAGKALSIKVPSDIFTDPDGDAMTYSASLLDPDWGELPLPSWLKFDSATMTLSGTPGEGNVGAIFVEIVAKDTHGVINGGAFQLTVEATPVDTTPPTVSSFGPATQSVVKADVSYALVFSEPVTGLASDDFLITNGAVKSMSGSGTTYAVTVSPLANTEGIMTVSLRAGAVADAAGNPSAALSAAGQVTIDTKVPAEIAFQAPVAPSDNLVLTFSEAVTKGSGNVVLRTAAGDVVEKIPVSSSEVAVSGAMVTINPALDLMYGAGYTVSLDQGGIKDLVGNDFAGMQLSFSTVAYQNHTPTGFVKIGAVGNPIQGQTLSVSNTLADADGMGMVSYDWQMLAATGWVDFASGANLVLAEPQVGKVLRVVAEYVDGHGMTESAASASTGAVSAPPPQTGGSGDDKLQGGLAGAVIDGKEGLNTVVYAGTHDQYSILVNPDRSVATHGVSGLAGSDTLVNVERIQFADTKVALDLDGNAGLTAKILGAVFGKTSVAKESFSKEYVGIGLGFLDGGMNYADLMLLALNAKLGAGFTDTAEINLLYQNLVGTPPSNAERDYWKGTLSSKQFTQSSLAVMAAEQDYNKVNIDLVGLAKTGIEFS